jgi:hypothetical protein
MFSIQNRQAISRVQAPVCVRSRSTIRASFALLASLAAILETWDGLLSPLRAARTGLTTP